MLCITLLKQALQDIRIEILSLKDDKKNKKKF